MSDLPPRRGPLFWFLFQLGPPLSLEKRIRVFWVIPFSSKAALICPTASSNAAVIPASSIRCFSMFFSGPWYGFLYSSGDISGPWTALVAT